MFIYEYIKQKYIFEIVVRYSRICVCRPTTPWSRKSLLAARIVLSGRARRHLTLSSPRAKKMHVYVTRTIVAWRWCLSSDKNKWKARDSLASFRESSISPFSGRILYFYAWHGHRRIRCQSPRSCENAKVCAWLVWRTRTHVRTHARTHRRLCEDESCDVIQLIASRIRERSVVRSYIPYVSVTYNIYINRTIPRERNLSGKVDVKNFS